MIERVIAKIFGYLIISVTGPRRVAFLNMCTAKGVPLWSVRSRERELRLCTSIAGFRLMRRPARQTGSQVSVVARRGLPFILQRLQRRAAFSMGALTFLFIIWAMSSFVWFIDVRGSELVEDQDIMGALTGQGLYVGVLRKHVEQDKIAHSLLKEFPQLVWASVSLRGSTATVTVVDRAIAEPMPKTPGDVVAKKPGIMVKLIATAGQAAALPGETVGAGQVLISGTIIVDDQLVEETRAEGLALARVWYETRGLSQLRRQAERISGSTAKADMLIIMGKWEFVLTGPHHAPYEHYHQEETKRILLPGVEHISRIYREFIIETEEVSEEEAKQEALLKAKALLLESLPPDSDIIAEEVEHRLLADDNTLEVRILVETVEDIGHFLAYTHVP